MHTLTCNIKVMLRLRFKRKDMSIRLQKCLLYTINLLVYDSYNVKRQLLQKITYFIVRDVHLSL